MPPTVWRICSSDKNQCDFADAQKQRASRQQWRGGAVSCLFYGTPGTAKWAGHERLICSDKLRKNKHGKSSKIDETPCALESQPCRLRRRANNLLTSQSCPAKMGSFHSLLRQENCDFADAQKQRGSSGTAERYRDYFMARQSGSDEDGQFSFAAQTRKFSEYGAL